MFFLLFLRIVKLRKQKTKHFHLNESQKIVICLRTAQQHYLSLESQFCSKFACKRQKITHILSLWISRVYFLFWFEIYFFSVVLNIEFVSEAGIVHSLCVDFGQKRASCSYKILFLKKSARYTKKRCQNNRKCWCQTILAFFSSFTWVSAIGYFILLLGNGMAI